MESAVLCGLCAETFDFTAAGILSIFTLKMSERCGMASVFSILAESFVFHFLWFYYSSSVLEGGSGEPFVSYHTVIHNLPRNYQDIINHPYGQLL